MSSVLSVAIFATFQVFLFFSQRILFFKILFLNSGNFLNTSIGEVLSKSISDIFLN